MDKFIGQYLSLQCGSKGIYQGRILDVKPSCLKLDKACVNGIPSEKIIEIKVCDIVSLEILETPSSVSRPTRSISSNSSKNQIKVERPVPVRAPSGAEVRASPRKLDGKGTSKEKLRQRRDEEAFGTPVDLDLAPDFDFEKNLALFDKKAVYDEINAAKPDLVRNVDKNNYGHNEYVLQRQATRFKQIKVYSGDGIEYVTDSGLVVPSIPVELRCRLLDLAAEVGLTFEKQGELLGRAVTENALHLLGGAHRLNPHNHHQRPSVAVLCGVHRAGLAATSAARQLASHGVRALVYVDESTPQPLSPHAGVMLKEESLLRHAGITVSNDLQVINSVPVDLIILALADPDNATKGTSTHASRWAQNNRAPIMSVEPPKLGTAGVQAKCSVTAALPLALDPSNGQVYLCNIGIPIAVFKTAGIDYLPPFGPKFVIPLHPNNF